MSNNGANRTTVLRGAAASRATSAIDGNSMARFDRSMVTNVSAAERMAVERQAAIDKGYREGLANARAEVEAAMNESNTRVRRALNALVAAIDAFDTREAIGLAKVEDSIVASAIAISRAILQREITVATDPGAEAVARAMALAPARGAVIARLNPHDAATLSLESLDTSNRSIEIVADPHVELGGCVVECEDTIIDAQISSAVAKVEEALFAENGSEEISESMSKKSQKVSAATGSSPKRSRTTASEAPIS